MKITLSFDNGPEPKVTPGVLDALERHGIRSTFFVVGRKLDDHGRELVQRAHSAGHWIGNHTFSHSGPLGRLSAPDEASQEIERTQELIAPWAHPDRLFRPVGGGGGGVIDRQLLNPEALDILVDGAFTLVLWNCIPRDWEPPHKWVDRALVQCRAQQHSLIVLHDQPEGVKGHLEEFIERALAEGAEFVQELPAECTPIVRGQVTGAVEHMVSR